MTTYSQKINQAIEQLGIDKLTAMQQEMLAGVASQSDITLLAPTGSGKTLAFLLPLLNSLDIKSTDVQVLIIAPSRELAIQIASVWEQMKNGFRVTCCYGGHSMADEKNQLVNLHPSVVVGTPGRILDHLERGFLQTSSVKQVIIDEFDKSLELGFQEQMEQIVDALPVVEQHILVSATDTSDLPAFADMSADAIRVNYLTDQKPLTIYRVDSPEKDKIESLHLLLSSFKGEQAILFCNYRESVERICAQLADHNVASSAYHGGMEQEDRELSLFRFSVGASQLLVSTDLAARGLDIPNVKHIVHYHLPVDGESFTHRNGRTARWESDGAAYLLLHSSERIPDYIQEKLDELGDFPEWKLPGQLLAIPKPAYQVIYVGRGKQHKLSKGDLVGFFCKIGGLKSNDIGRILLLPRVSFVSVKSSSVKQMLRLVQGEKIKGQKTIFKSV